MNKDFLAFRKKIGEYGVVTKVTHPLIEVTGLPHARLHEVVLLPDGSNGEIIAINEDSAKIMVFSETPVRSGMEVVRTDTQMSIEVGDEILGTTIDSFGTALSKGSTLKNPVSCELYRSIIGISGRKRITHACMTGTALVDTLVPLGKGQRELVIGDRGTGKTSFVLTTLKYQILHENTVVVYAAIGRKKSEIKQLEEFFIAEKLFQNVVLVASSADDPQSTVIITPYAATAIAEYFRDKGRNVVLVYDDLSTHAKHYREINLLAANFPGRDSYPGNIFSLQAQLLERSGNFIHKTAGEVSVTCLPIVETVEGELTSYIPTNVMGMTDGHIYFDKELYQQGRRMAVHTGLSVTRVGRQTQTPLQGEITQLLNSFLNNYEGVKGYAHFGSELSPAIKNTLRKGEIFYILFDQKYGVVVPEPLRLLFFALVWNEWLLALSNTEIFALKEKISSFVTGKTALGTELEKVATVKELLKVVEAHKKEIL